MMRLHDRLPWRQCLVRLGLLGASIMFVASVYAQQPCLVLEDFSATPANSFPSGWTPREPAGKGIYTVVKEGEFYFLRAKTSGANGAPNGIEVDRPVKWNLAEYPILQWRWRPRVLPRGADEQSGKDDSVLGVYIGFCPPQDIELCQRSIKGNLSWSDRIAMPKLLLTKGVGSLKYIWSERLAQGVEFDQGRKLVKVLESGAPSERNRWVQERIDVAADFRRRFGVQQAANPVGISLLTDSDDTQTSAEGDYADFKVCRQ